MTELTLDREIEGVEIPNLILKLIAITLMASLLYGATHLLYWAVNTKLSNSDITATSDITAEFREKQLTCLSRAVYYEAGSEPFEGKAAVAQVVLNRVNSGKFPKDVCKTIYETHTSITGKVVCQFDGPCNNISAVVPKNAQNYIQSMEASKKVLLEGFRLPSLNEALYFHNTQVGPNRPESNRLAKIGNHIFYK
jgi:spore germination cell wall hydrolase CwlJ-like protein